MELKLTFEDGSSGYLAHYGVKGMKWKDHVAQQDDEQKKAKRLRTIQSAMSQAVSGVDAKKAKAKVKARFAKKKNEGRKDLSGRGVLMESVGDGKVKTSYY